MARQGIINKIAPWLDYFTPKRERSKQDLYRLRFVIAVLLAFFVYCLLLLLASPVMPIRPAGRELLIAFCQVTALGTAFGLLILRITGSQRACLQLVILTLLVSVVNISTKLGGIYSPAAIVVLIIPALATIILGARMGMAWTVVLILVLAGFYHADQLGIVFPSVMRSANRSFGIFMSLTSTIVVVSVILLFYEITTQQLNQRLQKAHDNYLFQANHDSLTGLANRRHFIQIIDSHIDRAAPASERFAILFFDLNRFKEANDKYDHQFGDEVLVEVAKRLCRDSRNTDYVARWGGDEFAVLLPGISKEADVLTRINEFLTNLRQPMQIRDTQYCIDASIGYALFPAHGTTHEALIHYADHEMYGIKRQQGN